LSKDPENRTTDVLGRPIAAAHLNRPVSVFRPRFVTDNLDAVGLADAGDRVDDGRHALLSGERAGSEWEGGGLALEGGALGGFEDGESGDAVAGNVRSVVCK